MLSYLVAAAVVVDVPAKQRLLAATDAAEQLRLELSLQRSRTGHCPDVARSAEASPASPTRPAISSTVWSKKGALSSYAPFR